MSRSEPAAPMAAGPAPHILVVDDDAGVRTLLTRLLRQSGYEVTGVDSAAELRSVLAQDTADLILLDIMMPGEDGFSLCRSIRATSTVPIIMVSARGQEADRVHGLDLGADDYVAKPFGRPELLARIRAVLRRHENPHGQLPQARQDRYRFAGWSYRPRHHELISPAGVEVDLTGAEHDLLLTLLRNPQRAIGRERLLEMSRARRAHESDRSIDVLISRLRSKLRDNARSKPFIRTVRGVGYMLAVPVEAD